MTADAPRVWITRARPGAEATAARLQALGFKPLIDPLIEVRDLPWSADLAGVGALAFTSRNGVAAFARGSSARGLPVFAVGAATADLAAEAGFSHVESAEGDVADLAALIVARRGAFAGAVLHPAAAEPAGDLVSPLRRVGIEARPVAVYESVARAPGAETLAALHALSAVLLHSPKAARALAALLAERPAPGLRALCLSPAVAAPLAGLSADGRLGPVAAAPRPRETALFDLLSP
ncbi:uroporphyrinogen-III synthase [Caulobacter flavus]|uniref:Uroporphyrinogen-III synthase n=1 Tax=Caulobacter flavus TaxID=1679497 RepID=A0A2N5CQC0_9CAUL|nr:uroporphyrinogen-III synthase [Caulobacter flavus]AYV46290.1 uroporphyrinogen-III synthase [Caulobacter flavus]PLR10010.1 uroporphyrinogen-III synthase [Caulobacter flavus]